MNTRTATSRRTARRTRLVTVLRILGTGFAVSLGLGLGLAAPAQADPPRVPIDLVCDEIGPVTITVPGNGAYTPGLVAGSTLVGIPYAFTFSGTFTPNGGEPQPFFESYGRPAPAHDRLDRCTFTSVSEDEFGVSVTDIVIWLSHTPR